MHDQFNVKVFDPHILKIPVVLLVLFVISLSDVYASTGNEKNPKKNPKTNSKIEKEISIETDELTPVIVDEKATNDESVVRPYYQQPYLEKQVSSSGEDQNAVLSFNVIQYIFQRFKFSEEVY